MGVLDKGLFEAGLISEKQLQEQGAKEQLEDEQKSRAQIARLAPKKDTQTASLLDDCMTMHDFKLAAKQILLKDPSKIKIIINKAHRFKNDNQGRRFVWFFYKVRDGLRDLPAAKREQFLNKAFRKHGSTFIV